MVLDIFPVWKSLLVQISYYESLKCFVKCGDNIMEVWHVTSCSCPLCGFAQFLIMYEQG